MQGVTVRQIAVRGYDKSYVRRKLEENEIEPIGRTGKVGNLAKVYPLKALELFPQRERSQRTRTPQPTPKDFRYQVWKKWLDGSKLPLKEFILKKIPEIRQFEGALECWTSPKHCTKCQHYQKCLEWAKN